MAAHEPRSKFGRMRMAAVGDARAMAAIYAPYVRETAISFELEPPSEARMTDRIEKVLPTLPWLVWERDGEVVGYAYASQHRERAAYQWSVDTALYVAPQAHRMGVGRSLYEALARMLRLQGFHRAHAGITLPNDASVALHEAVGYSSIGVYREVGFKLGAWRDVGWWTLVLTAADPAPAPPRPFTPAIFHQAMKAPGAG